MRRTVCGRFLPKKRIVPIPRRPSAGIQVRQECHRVDFIMQEFSLPDHKKMIAPSCRSVGLRLTYRQSQVSYPAKAVRRPSPNQKYRRSDNAIHDDS